MAQYNYTKTPVSVDRLTQEIRASAIAIALDHIDLFGAAVSIFFKANLPEGDVSILDALVDAHSGQPLPDTFVQNVAIQSTPAPAPFAAKTIGTKKLYKRVHGVQQAMEIGPNTVIFTIPYAWAKITGIELVGGEALDTASFYILDSAAGTYSTVPNYQLNQFGFAVNVGPGYYAHTSEYDADLYQGMQVKVTYTSISAKTAGINVILNEVK